MPVRIQLLSRRITVSSIADAVRGVVKTDRRSLHRAMYQAAAGSPLLAAGIAEAYPFTLCPKAGCVSPIAHKGDCHVDHDARGAVGAVS